MVPWGHYMDVVTPDGGDETPPEAPSGGALSRIRRGWRRLRARWYGRWAIDLLIILAVFWAISRFRARHLLHDGNPAPAFALRDLAGQTHQLADYRGKPVLLVFTAPWCTVCQLEADNWTRVQDWVGEDARVVAVALGYEDQAQVERMVADERIEVPVLLGGREIAEAYRVEAYPTHYVIDAQGQIGWQDSGYATTLGLWARVAAE